MLDQYNNINIPCPADNCYGSLIEPLIWDNEVVTGWAPTRRVFGQCSKCKRDMNIDQFQEAHRWFASRYYISGELDGTGKMPSDTRWHSVQPVPKTVVAISVKDFIKSQKLREKHKSQATEIISGMQRCHNEFINSLDLIKELINRL